MSEHELSKQGNVLQLHSSHLNMLWRCGIQFENRYVKKHIRPPGVASVVGTATHLASSKHLIHKAETGDLWTAARVRDVARDALERAWTDRGVQLLPEEQERGLRRTKGFAVDATVNMAAEHAAVLAPVIKPAKGGVGWKWVVGGVAPGVTLAGELDVLERDSTVRDLKTVQRTKGQREADTSEQMSVYALARKVHTGKLPKRVVLDEITRSDDASKVIARSFPSTRDMKDLAVTMARVKQAVEVIQSGIFTPANQSDWWCSTKWCGFAATCPYFRGRVTVATGGTKHGG